MAFAFEELDVYQKALGFAVSVIQAVDEMDMPRKQFLYIARGSLYETVTRLKIFEKLSWLSRKKYESLYSEAEEINRMLSGLINAIS